MGMKARRASLEEMLAGFVIVTVGNARESGAS